jgi:hypothetical protein
MFWSPLLAALLAGLGPALSDTSVTIAVDSARKELTVTAGPYHLPNLPPMEEHGMMHEGMVGDTPLGNFDWPLDGWLRGFRVALVNGRGEEVPRHVLHHLIVVNFSRRQLVYPASERLMGAGSETADVTVPKTVGIPLHPGMRLGVYVAWHNDTGKDLEDVYLKITMLWTPRNQNPPPANSMPVYFDVNLTVGGSNTFDAPPGRSEKAFDFTVPVSGRLLGVGGHMHDHGVRVRLMDAESGKEVTEVAAKLDSAGTITGVERHLFGIWGDGLKLKADHRYRLIGEYDNPTGEPLERVMAHMVGLFVPDDMSQWPKIDPADPDYRRDLASLQVGGGEVTREAHTASHEHGAHH